MTEIVRTQSAAHSMASNLENSAVATGLEKVSFHSNPKEGNAKKCSNYCTIAFISHASKVRLKILQVRHKQYVNQELPDVQTGFRKGRGRKEILKIKAEINAKETKETITKINKAKSFGG